MEETQFIGHWHFEKQIGCGGFGFVSLWENMKTGQKIAIKKCQINPNLDQLSLKKLEERWNREIKYMTHEVKNDNIVQGLLVTPNSFLMELNKSSPMPILVMEYCEGGDLRTLLNKQKNTNGLMESEVRGVLKCLLSAISYLHAIKVSHRDIKPENCVIKTNPQGEKIYKLTDLGYAKAIDRHSLIASIVGTPGYVAPEILISDTYSNSCDYWSFGIIAFEIIAGIRPFELHIPLPGWMTAVRKKKSEHICITESNEGITYGSSIFPENQVSSCFKTHMENWLRLALQWNPKHRGHVVKSQKSKSVSLSDMSNTLPPISVLKFFTMLHDILSKNILTVFCLYTYQSHSYDIDATTTIDDFLDSIEKSTTIQKENILLIIPVDNHQLEKIDKNTRPIDLLLENYFDKPMLFVGYKGKTMKSDNTIEIPDLIKLTKADCKIMKPHILNRYISAVSYFIRNEQKKYVTLLDGFYNYSLQLNHQIELYETDINKMLKLTYGLRGAVELLDYMLAASKVKDDELFQLSEINTKLRIQCQDLQNNIGVLVGSSDRIVSRFRSVLRRSRELLIHPLLVKGFYKNDYFNIAELSIKSKVGREHSGRNNDKDNQLIDIFKRAYNDCLNKREELLRADQFVKFQKQIVNVSIELEEIKNAAKNAIFQGEIYERELRRVNDDIVEQSRHCESHNKMNLLQDIEQILDSNFIYIDRLNFNIGQPVKSGCNIVSDSLKFSSLLASSSIIENNEVLRKRLADAVQEVEREFTTTKNPR